MADEHGNAGDPDGGRQASSRPDEAYSPQHDQVTRLEGSGQPPTGQPPSGQSPAGQPPSGQSPAGQSPGNEPPADTQRLLAGRYRLDQLLGRGSMGAVWKAHDVVLRRSVAVKEVLLPPTQTAEENEVARERALREARAIAALSHPNVVTLFDVVEDDGRPWVVMELVPARSLAEIIKARGPLGPVDAARIGLAVLGALDSAHEVGITHRDVKPGNILVSGDGRVKLADFGISRKVDESSLTQTGLMVGSPSYIAPEVARGKEATRAADIWGLGATLHCAVEGTPPFDMGDPVATLTAVVGEPPRPAPHAGPLTGAIARALDKDPRTRIRSDELREQLSRVASRPQPPPPPPNTGQQRVPRPVAAPMIAPPGSPTQQGSRQRAGAQWQPPPPVGPPSQPMSATGQYPPHSAAYAAPAQRTTAQPTTAQPTTAQRTTPQPMSGFQAAAGAAPHTAAHHASGTPGRTSSSSNSKAWIIAGCLLALAAIAAVVLIIVLGRDDNGTNGQGTGETTSSSASESASESVAPTSNDSKITDGVASGAIAVGDAFYPFSFTIGEGWEVAKSNNDRSEFILTGSDDEATSVVKVTVVAENLVSANVHEQLLSQGSESGSPATLPDYEPVNYQKSGDGNTVYWEYSNSMQGDERHGFMYALSKDQAIMWKFIVAGTEDDTELTAETAQELQASVTVE